MEKDERERNTYICCCRNFSRLNSARFAKKPSPDFDLDLLNRGDLDLRIRGDLDLIRGDLDLRIRGDFLYLGDDGDLLLYMGDLDLLLRPRDLELAFLVSLCRERGSSFDRRFVGERDFSSADPDRFLLSSAFLSFCGDLDLESADFFLSLSLFLRERDGDRDVGGSSALFSSSCCFLTGEGDGVS